MNTLTLLKKRIAVLLISFIMTLGALAEDHDHGHIYEGASAYYLAEHGDFEIGYEDGELEMHIHLHAGTIVDGNVLEEDTSFAPEQLVVVATETAEILRPDGSDWQPTGVDVNETLWVLPQHEKEGLPALGFSTHDIDTGLFVEDQIQLRLRALQGPGDFSLWEDNALGQPIFYISSYAGQTSAVFPIGLHAHHNWGFSAPGDYILVFEATADLVTGGSAEALSIYRFKVTDVPLRLQPLPGDVNGDGHVDEHDLHIVEDNLGETAPTWPANSNLAMEQTHH
ncbi:choice-of-anchor M domain-containing protein [Planctomycetota bacterium]